MSYKHHSPHFRTYYTLILYCKCIKRKFSFPKFKSKLIKVVCSIFNIVRSKFIKKHILHKYKLLKINVIIRKTKKFKNLTKIVELKTVYVNIFVCVCEIYRTKMY